MRSPSAIGVNDDLAASQTGVTLWTTNDEKARWLELDGRESQYLSPKASFRDRDITYMVNGLVIEVLLRDYLLDDLLFDLLADLLSSDVLTVLSTNNYCIDANRHNSSTVVGVFDSDLSLGVGPQPRKRAILAGRRHGMIQLVSELDREGQKLGSLVAGITEHNTLVTGAELLQSLVVVKTLCDIGRLLLNGDQDVTSLIVEALGRIIVSNVLNRVANDFLVVEMGLGSNLAEDHNHTGLSSRLASDLGERILC